MVLVSLGPMLEANGEYGNCALERWKKVGGEYNILKDKFGLIMIFRTMNEYLPL